MGVIAYYNIKYYIRFYCQLVINLIVDFSFAEYIKILHYVFHWTDGVPIF
jgi:hypothetical protein